MQYLFDYVCINSLVCHFTILILYTSPSSLLRSTSFSLGAMNLIEQQLTLLLVLACPVGYEIRLFGLEFETRYTSMIVSVCELSYLATSSASFPIFLRACGFLTLRGWRVTLLELLPVPPIMVEKKPVLLTFHS